VQGVIAVVALAEDRESKVQLRRSEPDHVYECARSIRPLPAGVVT
jgi:hypothetical protein